MKYIAFIITLAFLIMSYNQWIRIYIKRHNKKAVKCFIEGFSVSFVLMVIWSFITRFSNVVMSSVVGVAGTWILSFLWERYGDKTPDVDDTPMRLLTASVPFIIALLVGVLIQ